MRPDAAAMEVRTPDVLTFRNTLCTKLYYIPTVYTLFLQYYIEISYYCLPDGFRLSGFTTVHYIPTVLDFPPQWVYYSTLRPDCIYSSPNA